jgi:hypothetical protein
MSSILSNFNATRGWLKSGSGATERWQDRYGWSFKGGNDKTNTFTLADIVTNSPTVSDPTTGTRNPNKLFHINYSGSLANPVSGLNQTINYAGNDTAATQLNSVKNSTFNFNEFKGDRFTLNNVFGSTLNFSAQQGSTALNHLMIDGANNTIAVTGGKNEVTARSDASTYTLTGMKDGSTIHARSDDSTYNVTFDNANATTGSSFKLNANAERNNIKINLGQEQGRDTLNLLDNARENRLNRNTVEITQANSTDIIIVDSDSDYNLESNGDVIITDRSSQNTTRIKADVSELLIQTGDSRTSIGNRQKLSDIRKNLTESPNPEPAEVGFTTEEVHEVLHIIQDTGGHDYGDGFRPMVFYNVNKENLRRYIDTLTPENAVGLSQQTARKIEIAEFLLENFSKIDRNPDSKLENTEIEAVAGRSGDEDVLSRQDLRGLNSNIGGGGGNSGGGGGGWSFPLPWQPWPQPPYWSGPHAFYGQQFNFNGSYPIPFPFQQNFYNPFWNNGIAVSNAPY